VEQRVLEREPEAQVVPDREQVELVRELVEPVRVLEQGLELEAQVELVLVERGQAQVNPEQELVPVQAQDNRGQVPEQALGRVLEQALVRERALGRGPEQVKWAKAAHGPWWSVGFKSPRTPLR